MGTEPRTRTVRGGDQLSLAVAEWGDAASPTIVLIHGYPDTKDLWTQTAHRLAETWHVVAYDVRGAGDSAAPKDRSGYALARLAEDFLAVVDAVAPDKRVHLVGHDWGSTQGWEFATEPATANRIASFTSISGPCLDQMSLLLRERAPRPSWATLRRGLSQLAKSWYIGLFCLPAVPEWLWQHGLAGQWPRILRDVDKVPDWDRPQPTLATDGANGVNLYRANMPSRLRHPRPNPVALTPVQLVVVVGDRFLVPETLDGVERWVPRLRRKTVASSHWLPRTRPDVLAQWVAEFVADVEAERV